MLAAILAAFVVELVCYFTVARRATWTLPRLWISALAPFLLYSIPAGVFRPEALAVLAVLAALSVWWLPLTGRLPASDLVYLAFVAAAHLAGWHKFVYARPAEGIATEALGQLLWFRLGLASILARRGSEGIGFGFFPSASDWRIGVKLYVYCIPVVVSLMYLLDAAHFGVVRGAWWRAPATFLGILWVVALGEEVFFRGLLLERLRSRWGTVPALVVSSVLFGCVHLWYNRAFPNWKVVLLASAAGLFYGRAYIEARGVRAAMVAHALVVTTWKTLFTG